MPISKITRVCKVNVAKRVLIAPALIPEVFDQQGTIISDEVIEDAVYDFMHRIATEQQTVKGTGIGVMHTQFSKNQWMVESYLLDRPTEFLTELKPEDVEGKTAEELDIRVPIKVEKNADGTNTGNVYVILPKGTWMLGTQYAEGNPAWDHIEAGTYNGYSIEGDAWKIDL